MGTWSLGCCYRDTNFKVGFLLQGTNNPLIVVGLPRSGSSFLAHVLSRLENLWIFDDLYAVQKAEAVGFGPLDGPEVETFLDRLAWETRARVIWEDDFSPPIVSLDEIDEMERLFLGRYRELRPLWHEITADWLTELAGAHGCSRWGYKTPQDFLHLDMLKSVWPGARFIYLMRDPRDIMASYKNLEARKGGDGDPRSYHPVAYALYWRMAHRRLMAAMNDGAQEITIVRFEDLVAEPERVARSLAAFVGTTAREVVATESHNSSHDGSDAPRRAITDTEVWIVQALAGDEMDDAGYERRSVRPKISDIPELGRVSFGFVSFQLRRVFVDPEKRASVRRVARSIIRG